MADSRLTPRSNRENFLLLRPVDGPTIALLAKNIGRDYYMCGLSLGIRPATLESIRDRNTTSLENMSAEILEQWKKMRGSRASSEELHEAFVNSERLDLAEMLETDPPIRERCNALDRRNPQALRRMVLRKHHTVDGCCRQARLSKAATAVARHYRKSRDDLYLDELSEDWGVLRAHHKVEYEADQRNSTRTSMVSLHPVKMFPGYFEFLSREQGTRKLHGAKEGTYLIRQRIPKSSKDKFHRHTLMIIVHGEISNIKILMRADQLYLESNGSPVYFKTLFELVEWHKTYSFMDVSDEGCHRVRLIHPVE